MYKFLLILLILLKFYYIQGNSASSAQIAANYLPAGIKSVKQKSAAHGFDPEQVYGNTDDGGVVKAYRPILFEKLRESAGIEENEFIESLRPDTLQCLNSDSKSGQAFWISLDGKLVVKTIKQYECKTLRNILDSYALHCLTGASTIGNILGLYRIKGKFSGAKYILVSKNIYPTSEFQSSSLIAERFDLKGSTIGRLASPSSSVLKDLNLIQSGRLLSIGPNSKEVMLRILQRDLQYLSKKNLMDYSLLVAVEKAGSSEERRLQMNKNNKDGGKIMLPGMYGQVFHFGIIDFLQKYTFRKMCETLIKSFYTDGKKISAVNPSYYAKRMLEFLANITQ